MTEVHLDLSRAIEWDDEDLEFFANDFDLVPGDDGRWYARWRAERECIASWPTLAAAKLCLLGDWDGTSGNPGWPRTDIISVDVVGALYGYRERHGRFPRLELDADATVIELFARIHNDCAFIGQLMWIEHDTSTLDPGLFYPTVTRLLAAGDFGLDARASARKTPWFCRMLICAYAPNGLDDVPYSPTIPARLAPPVAAWLARIGREDLIKICAEEGPLIPA